MNEKKYRITLTDDEREYLMTLIRKGKTTARTLTRVAVPASRTRLISRT